MHLLWRWRFLLFILTLLVPGPAPALEEQGHSAHQFHDAPSSQDSGQGVGLDEQLGRKIPLDLVFKDSTGQPRRLSELIDGPTIILPVYYACTNVCNFMQEGLTRALPEVNLKPGEDYRVLSVSFDETETPERAARARKMYRDAMGEKFPEGDWLFLTGDAASIQKLTRAAGYSFRRQGVDFVHPVVSFVVAKDGMIVRYLYGTHFLPKDLTLALIEARQGRVGTTISKMVSYCFSFDPEKKSYQFNLLRVSATVIIVCVLAFLAFLILGGKKGKKERPDRG